MEKEYKVFSIVIKNITIEHGENLSINFMSSAGGIYEGTENVNRIDEVCLVRPYGIWKLKQEE